jgi:hypothetical protein
MPGWEWRPRGEYAYFSFRCLGQGSRYDIVRPLRKFPVESLARGSINSLTAEEQVLRWEGEHKALKQSGRADSPWLQVPGRPHAR